LLKSYPHFSVDSTTWLGGSKYGTSYVYDGKNAKTKDFKNKYIRKADKQLCEKIGISLDDLVAEKRSAVNRYNLEGWKGFRREYIRYANTKLWTEAPHYYDKSRLL
jgi:hypothetical protein